MAEAMLQVVMPYDLIFYRDDRLARMVSPTSLSVVLGMYSYHYK